MTGVPSRLRHWGTVKGVTVVMTILTVTTGSLAACGTHPGLSNGSLSACYRAIPAASAATHQSHPRFLGVHRLAADEVAHFLPPGSRPQAGSEFDTTVCAVTFEGTFTAGQVTKANPVSHGRYAIILVSSRHLQLVTSFVLDHLPKRFKGRFI